MKRTPKKIFICVTTVGDQYATGGTLEEAFNNYKKQIDDLPETSYITFYSAEEIEVEIKTVITPVTCVTAK